MTNIDNDGNENVVTISYKIKLIDSARFTTSLLTNFVDNLAEEIYEIKCKDFDCILEYESVNDNLIKHKILSYNKDNLNKLDEKLEKRFKNTLRFSDYDINKFILLLRKGVYPYDHLDEWEKFNKTLLPEKEQFYCNLNKEDIADADYMHAKRVCKDFEIKKLGEYHDLYLQSDTLLLADVFENFSKNMFKNLQFGPCKISFSSWISMASRFKKDWSKIRIINWYWYAVNGWKGIRGETCHETHQYAKANNKYIKDYDKNKKHMVGQSRKSFQEIISNG